MPMIFACVTAYSDVNFTGNQQIFGPGSYDMGQLTVGNDAIRSLRVPAGLIVTLFEHAGFQGRSKRFTADTAFVGDDFNAITSSIIVAAVSATTNALTDFDLCLNLSQQVINRQIATAWEAWKRRSQFTDTIRIFKVIRDGQLVDATTGLEARIEPLTIDLNVPDGKPGQVRVTLRLPSGTVRYYDQVTGDVKDCPFTDWSISYIADLDKKAIDPNLLKQIDPEAYSVVQSMIQTSGQSESVFAIEYLYMKFTDTGLMLAGNKAAHIPEKVDTDAREIAVRSLKLLLNGDLKGLQGGYLLGAVVHRPQPPTNATFALTDFVFYVQSNARALMPGTLSYLGKVARRPMPQDVDAARDRVKAPWVLPQHLGGSGGSLAGVLAISKNVFMDLYLIPQFTRRIGSSPSVSGLTYTFQASHDQPSKSDDIIDREWCIGRSWSLSITVRPGSNTLSIAGVVSSYARMDGYTKGAHWHTESMHIAGHQNLTGSVTLDAESQGLIFGLKPRLNREFHGLAVDRDEISGGARVLNAFESFFGSLGIQGRTTAERLQGLQRQEVQRLSDWLNQVFNSIDLDLSQHAFIPPGGAVYTYESPQFTNAGDLLLDVTARGI